MNRFSKNLKGQKVPVYTREDLIAMNKGRRDATLYEISPVQGRPGAHIFFFDMGNGELKDRALYL